MFRIVQILLIAKVFLTLVHCEKRLRFMPNEINVWSDNKYVNFTYTIDKAKPGADLTYKVLKPIQDLDITIEGKSFVKGEERHGATWRVTFSFCKILSMRNANGITMFIYSNFKSLGKIPDECPIKKGVYKLQNLWIPEELIPSNFPELNFDINFQADAIEGNDIINILNSSITGDAVLKDVPRSGHKLSILGG